MVRPGDGGADGTRHSPRHNSARISVVEQERRRSGQVDNANHAGASVHGLAFSRRHPTNASSAGSGLTTSHSLPHLMHLR